ncbi:hypothetical protein SLEP1_g12546 [Rubroshorea leprosula]|uniref:Uncharacterized protein n=1 Tax=Rubroshorea leprosula TaxID=152421 RepID=A0AAV5IKU6_9ROSI|nr:hypothetical protein SLEP1_g12546 [Rubroshorea leprosula]
MAAGNMRREVFFTHLDTFLNMLCKNLINRLMLLSFSSSSHSSTIIFHDKERFVNCRRYPSAAEPSN